MRKWSVHFWSFLLIVSLIANLSSASPVSFLNNQINSNQFSQDLTCFQDQALKERSRQFVHFSRSIVSSQYRLTKPLLPHEIAFGGLIAGTWAGLSIKAGFLAPDTKTFFYFLIA